MEVAGLIQFAIMAIYLFPLIYKGIEVIIFTYRRNREEPTTGETPVPRKTSMVNETIVKQNHVSSQNFTEDQNHSRKSTKIGTIIPNDTEVTKKAVSEAVRENIGLIESDLIVTKSSLLEKMQGFFSDEEITIMENSSREDQTHYFAEKIDGCDEFTFLFVLDILNKTSFGHISDKLNQTYLKHLHCSLLNERNPHLKIQSEVDCDRYFCSSRMAPIKTKSDKVFTGIVQNTSEEWSTSSRKLQTEEYWNQDTVYSTNYQSPFMRCPNYQIEPKINGQECICIGTETSIKTDCRAMTDFGFETSIQSSASARELWTSDEEDNQVVIQRSINIQMSIKEVKLNENKAKLRRQKIQQVKKKNKYIPALQKVHNRHNTEYDASSTPLDSSHKYTTMHVDINLQTRYSMSSNRHPTRKGSKAWENEQTISTDVHLTIGDPKRGKQKKRSGKYDRRKNGLCLLLC